MADVVDEPVHLETWTSAWVTTAADVITECKALLAGETVALEHIGSTAVPGLVAKPIVDVLVGVAAGHRSAITLRLAAAGWTHLGEAGVPGRDYLRRRQGQHANLHVVDHDSALWDDNLLLRDYLRRSPGARQRYSDAKLKAAQQAATLIAYSELKAPVVATLLREARQQPETGRRTSDRVTNLWLGTRSSPTSSARELPMR